MTLMALLLFVINLIFFVLTSGSENQTNVITFNETIISTSMPPITTTMFHTTNRFEYYIDFRIIVTFECDNNTDTSHTTIECPDLVEITEIFTNIMNELSIEYDIMYKLEPMDADDIDDNTFEIFGTVETNEKDDYEALSEYLVSANFTNSIQGICI